MIQQIFHSKLEEFRGLRYLIVFDEIHRILPKFGGSGAGFTQIERGCREFRKWGIGIVLISQILSDFVGEIKANINTLVQMKTRDESDLERIKMQYGEEYIQSLIKSPVGSGMVQNSSWNRGRPYYVTFRPILHSVVRLTDEELDKYNRV
jgi:DNA helicase HerA-like ATPase